MSKFKVGDKVLWGKNVYEVEEVHISYDLKNGKNGIAGWVYETALKPYVPESKFKVGDLVTHIYAATGTIYEVTKTYFEDGKNYVDVKWDGMVSEKFNVEYFNLYTLPFKPGDKVRLKPLEFTVKTSGSEYVTYESDGRVEALLHDNIEKVSETEFVNCKIETEPKKPFSVWSDGSGFLMITKSGKKYFYFDNPKEKLKLSENQHQHTWVEYS